MTITSSTVLRGMETGTVRVLDGKFELRGMLNGDLIVESPDECEISGSVLGKLVVGSGATVRLRGMMKGETFVHVHGTLIVERSGMLSGKVRNLGKVESSGLIG